MKMNSFPARFATPILVSAAAVALPLHGQTITDDFDAGDDAEWTRLVPLAEIGGNATFSFPQGNTYRILSDASPDPGLAGPARAGAIRGDVSYEAFRIEVDLVDWDPALNQDIGLLARVSSAGLGTLDGYVWAYETGEEEIYLSRLDGEEPTILGSAPVALVEGQAYRLVFQGFEGSFCAEIFAADDLENPLATVLAFDLDHPSGFGGVFNNSVPDGGTTDATFDNYFSSTGTDTDKDGMLDQWEFDFFGELFWFDDEDFDDDGATNLEEFLGGSDPTDPTSLPGGAQLVITEVRARDGQFTLSFPVAANRNYTLETSFDLDTWTPQPSAVFSGNGTTGSLTIPTGGQAGWFGRVVETEQ